MSCFKPRLILLMLACVLSSVMSCPALADGTPGIQWREVPTREGETTPKITLHLPPVVIKGADTVTGMIRTSKPFDRPVSVVISYSGAWIRKPSTTLLFRAGAKSVKFGIKAPTTDRLDSGYIVRVAVMMGSKTVATSKFTIRDSNKALQPTLNLPQNLVEDAKWLPDGRPAPPVFGRVTIQKKAGPPIRIALSSTHSIKMTPSEIVILAGKTSAEFELFCPLDQL